MAFSSTRQKLIRPSVRPWGLEQVAGRLVEISGVGATAALTVAFGLVLEAQQRGEPVAWIALEERGFCPPDAAEGGVDLGALVVVRVANTKAVGRAADQLVRSGAFGLIVLDLGAGADVPTPLQTRLVGLAQKHQTALLCLTEKGASCRRWARSFRSGLRRSGRGSPMVGFRASLPSSRTSAGA